MAILLVFAPGAAAAADGNEYRRAEFRDAYVLARSGHAHVLKNHQATLSDYALWPDLLSASYLGRLKKTSDAAISAHLQRYPDTSLNRTLRYRFLTSLAQRKAWQPFLQIYAANFAGQGDTRLDCSATLGSLSMRPDSAAIEAALTLWMVGKSQPEDCDPLFRELASRGELTPARYTERLYLALARGEIDLASFLARNVADKDAAWVERWRRMRADPARELPAVGELRRSQARADLYAYGIRRLARRDAAAAHERLAATHKTMRLEREDLESLNEYVALRAAREGLPEASDWLASLPSLSDEAATWGVRATLDRADWPGVVRGIDNMNEKLRDEDTWRYWRARALEALGRGDEAGPLYAALATKRSYYAFLAADRLGQSYQFAHTSLAPDPAVWDGLNADPAIVRARELFFVGLYGPARSEWDDAVSTRDASVRRQAALLADSWGWHSSSIKTLARSAGRDDLIRFYPTPYKAEFDETTQLADIARTWAYGITRSESLFMSDVKSSAGAIGLMQLIPATGRETARRASLAYRGTATLLDPQSNIRLGVHYLGQMYDRFGDNQVLATAAYNAGPRRVKSWLPSGDDKPADVWIETIPFSETRNYVKRVLFADAVFHWRLTGTERRLAALMPPIGADRPGKVASK